MAKSPKSSAIERGEAHWIEWLTGSVSAICVIVLIGWIAFDAMTQDDGPPALSIDIVGSEGRAGGYLVTFDVDNAADRTAADVTVRGEIVFGDAVVETVETTIDYVPMRSKARGGLIFRTDPAGKSLRIAATGFSEP